MALFRKRWKNVLIIDNEKDAILIAAKENLGEVNMQMKDVYPLTLELPKERSYFTAIRKSIIYSKMGIFNLICETN